MGDKEFYKFLHYNNTAEKQSPTFLAPSTDFIEKNLFGWGGRGVIWVLVFHEEYAAQIHCMHSSLEGSWSYETRVTTKWTGGGIQAGMWAKRSGCEYNWSASLTSLLLTSWCEVQFWSVAQGLRTPAVAHVNCAYFTEQHMPVSLWCVSTQSCTRQFILNLTSHCEMALKSHVLKDTHAY